MTDQSTTRVLEAARQLEHAIADVPLAASGAEVCDALQMIALAAAEQVAAPRDIARTLMSHAERYLQRAQTEAGGSPASVTETAHGALESVVKLLRQKGLDDSTIREMMLGFVMAWVAKSEPEAGAALLYRHADALAGRMATAH